MVQPTRPPQLPGTDAESGVAGPMGRAEPASTRQEELRSFLFFTVVMAPILAFAIVGGYGFLVWMYQLIAGPPQA
jgi:nitrate reductase NapE